MPTTPSLPSFHDAPAARAFLSAFPRGRELYARLVRALYRDRLPWDRALGLVPAEVGRALAGRFVWAPAELRSCSLSPDGTAAKALWRAPDGPAYESVLMRHPSGRTTLCLSSQVGCPLGCAFCETGRMGLVRDLTAAEILGQALWAAETLAAEGLRLRNVVFMGMGEPLLALDSVYPALEGLLDQRRLEIAPRHLCVSTSGVVPAIEPFYRRFPKVKLAVSLHAPRQDLRDRLMPGCRHWPLADLMAALDGYAATTGHKLFFEYVMIAGVNDTDRELDELADLLRNRRAHVNLIPFNAAGTEGWEPSDRRTLDRFQRGLAAAGTVSTVRHSAGDSIAAACGQLARKSS